MEDKYSLGNLTTEPDNSAKPQETVGSRELKTRLGTYLRLVREGASFVITDRGRPVAELRPYTSRGEDLPYRLRELARIGVIGHEIAERRPLDGFEPIENSGAPASEAIQEDREDRF